MVPEKKQLGDVLPFFDYSVNTFLQQEISGLQLVIEDVLKSQKERESLEEKIVKQLEGRISGLKTQIMNLPISYTFNNLPRRTSLEQEIERIAIQKTLSQEVASRDLFEMKKLLWRYFLELNRKQSQLRFIST